MANARRNLGFMRIYHSIAEVLSDRRKGIGLNEVIDALLSMLHVWEPYGLTPFSAIPQLHKGDYVDMSTPTWRALSVERQIELGRGYQWWYANQCGFTDIHRTFNDGVEIKMVLIPPMRYLMGPDQESVLVVKPFWMGEHEVTQGQWVQVMGDNPSYFQGDLDLPVEQVSWNDCLEFCKATKTKLPTEEQWELACRAGTTTEYSFGSDLKLLGDYGWYRNNANQQTHTVKQKLPNAFDLYDMHGNVFEWCQNKYKSSGSGRGGRGGGWYSSADDCASADRDRSDPAFRGLSLGFRPVRSL